MAVQKRKPKPKKASAAAKNGEMRDRFVLEYLIDGNGTQAAIRAGYAENSAHSTASRLLKDAKVRARIEQGRAKVADKLEITAERIMAELAAIAFADLRKAFTWGPKARTITTATGETFKTAGVGCIPSDQIDDLTAAAISEIAETKDGLRVKFHSKTDALHKLGVQLGMFVQKNLHGEDPENPLTSLVQAAQRTALPTGSKE